MTRGTRESVGSALASGDLTWNEDGSEGAPDRLVASAWGKDELGRLLRRLRDGGDRTTATMRAALWTLVGRAERRGQLRRQRPDADLVAMCACALDEWMNDRCVAPGCVDGWTRLESTPRRCTNCGGTAHRAWTDDQRREKLPGVRYDARQYDRILQRLTEADNRHANDTKKGLAP